MSAKELVKMVGRTGYIAGRGDLDITVRIVDVKTSYGAVRYQVEPIAGRGSAWIDANSIELDSEGE